MLRIAFTHNKTRSLNSFASVMSLSEIYYFRYFNGILGADLGVFCTSSITINAVSLYKIRNFYVSDAGLT